MRGNGNQALSAGWHAEAFARTKRLEPLGKLLEPVKTPDEQRQEGADNLRGMIARMKRKQEAERGIG